MWPRAAESIVQHIGNLLKTQEDYDIIFGQGP